VAVGEDVGLEPVAGLPAAVVAGSSVKELEEAALRTRPEVLSARAEVEAARARAEVLRRERIPDVTIAAGWRHEEFSEILGVRLSVPLPFFRRNQGEIAGQEARIEQAAAAARQAELRIRLAVRGAYGSWQRAKAAAGAIAPDLESRLRGDVQALQLAYQRGTMQLPAVLAALRETQVARRALLDARVEAVQAALELARATGQSPCDAGGCR
jgi:cobalt-zinc-cadmium efflux system outer membrane protein